ncbi:MAG TPA: aminodeoxychorismate/anthranilate synthase component II [Allosphingosinicella sp.]|jgi:anthranilate synthase component 2|nr:aminodeoxychorismate/anthranilate synthase component II [Allosphingosinicella sp.]
MILVLDNYDSFTWNIVHYLRELGAEVRVERNDALDAAGALATGASAFLISPGPGRPEAAGASLALVAACAAQRRPLLGICLGHQAVAMHFGARVVRARSVMHGKTSAVSHDGTGLFEGLPSPLEAARYHSLTVAPESLPAGLAANATAKDGTVQGLRHETLPIHGVQFHPESVASREGHRLLANFIRIAERSAPA